MIKMRKNNSVKEVKDHSLVDMYEKAGWTKFLDAHVEVKAEVKAPKKEFTEIKKEISEQVDVTPTDKKASFNVTRNQGE
tara:strand:+ start:132 stop:368 length:237 start_codon:yes stop_codon:yes gene_type:complete